MTLKQIMTQVDRYNRGASALGLKPCHARLTIEADGFTITQEEILSAQYLENLVRSDWVDPIPDRVLGFDEFTPNESALILASIRDFREAIDGSGRLVPYARHKVLNVTLEVFQD